MRRLINIIYRMLKNNSEFYMPKDLEEKCKKVYLEKLEEEKEKKNTKSSVKSTNLWYTPDFDSFIKSKSP